MDSNNRNFSKRFDWPLAIILCAFIGVSSLAIASAQTSGQYGLNYVPLQLRGYVIFAIIVAFVMYFDPDQFKKMAWPLYGFGILLLIAMVVIPVSTGITVERNGAKSWFQTPIGNLQPAEFMKTFYILAAAYLISKHHERYQNKTIKTDFMLLGKIAIALVVPLGFIMLQPDLGSALVFIAITAALVVVAGVSWKILLPLFGGTALIGGSLLWMALYMQDFLENTFGFQKYQFARIYSWLDPYSYATSDGYHLITSLNAIGSGEITE